MFLFEFTQVVGKAEGMHSSAPRSLEGTTIGVRPCTRYRQEAFRWALLCATCGKKVSASFIASVIPRFLALSLPCVGTFSSPSCLSLQGASEGTKTVAYLLDAQTINIKVGCASTRFITVNWRSVCRLRRSSDRCFKLPTTITARARCFDCHKHSGKTAGTNPPTFEDGCF